MARNEQPDERTMVEEDRLRLGRALKDARRKKKNDAGAKDIADQLERVIGPPDLDDPQRFHGS
jgi:hypothetical protein